MGEKMYRARGGALFFSTGQACSSRALPRRGRSRSVLARLSRRLATLGNGEAWMPGWAGWNGIVGLDVAKSVLPGRPFVHVGV